MPLVAAPPPTPPPAHRTAPHRTLLATLSTVCALALPKAARRPHTLMFTSLALASATPTTVGRRER